MLTFEPLYYPDRITVVNPTGDVGVVTLWTPLRAAKRLLQTMSPDILDPKRSRVAVISNLYGDGMHQMFCNLLYNPQIRHLIAVGEELNLPTVVEIEAFMKYGLEEAVMLGTTVSRIPTTSRIFPVLKDFDAARLQRQLTFAYLGKLTGETRAARLPDYLSSLEHHSADAESERVRIEIPQALADGYAYQPSDVGSHQIARPHPLDCWEELVVRTARFGHPVNLGKGERLELLNTRAVIAEPIEESAETLSKYGFSLEKFRQYQDKMLDPEIPADISYTYGNRLRSFFKRDGRSVDTLRSVKEILRHDPESRHAFISLWDVPTDLSAAGSNHGSAVPCLVTIFFRRSQDKLTLTATYRSHNLLTAWLQNVYGLMRIQQDVCEYAGVEPGPITVISHSLGIDPSSPRYALARAITERWAGDEELDRDAQKRSLREDPNGYFVVTVDEENAEIVAEHRYGGILVKQYRGDRAVKIERQVIGDMAISLVSHAMWLSRELARKEYALAQRQASSSSGTVL